MPKHIAATNSAAPGPAPGTPAPPRSHWGRWLLGGFMLVILLGLVALQFLDPWLRSTLEQQVTSQTHGQYHLQIGALHTKLWHRTIRLQKLRLRPAAIVADTLPRLRLDVARLNVTGVGLWALLRKGVVPIDSVVLDSAHLEVLVLATQLTKNTKKPLHKRLPLQLQGLEIGYFGLQHTQTNYLPDTPTKVHFREATLSAHDLLISPAGAADSQRLGYAAAWNLTLLHTQAQAAGHGIIIGKLQASTADQRLQLDSVRVQPTGAARPGCARVHLGLARLRLTGIDAAALQHQHWFRADSLLVQNPQLTYTPAAQTAAKGSKSVADYLPRLDLAHFAVRNGYVRVAGIAQAPIIRNMAVSATHIHFNSAAAPDKQLVFFAKSWDVALGRCQATVAAHALTLSILNLSTTAGTFYLRSVRIRPPAPGQGKPGGMRVDLTLPSLAVTGLNAALLQQYHHFQASSLVLNSPKLNFTPPVQPPPPVWKLLSTFLRRSDLAQLQVHHANVQVNRWRHSPDVHDLNVTSRAIRIDSLTALEPRRIAYALGWQAHSGYLSVPFDPPFYRASTERAYLDTDAKTLLFSDLVLKPKYSAVGMNMHKGYQAPAVTIKIVSLAATGLDFGGLVRHGNFRTARATAQSPTVYIASDGRGPINPNWSKISPEEMLKLKNIVDVRRLDLINGNLYSSYRSPLTPITGTMNINRFNGSFFNLSNDPKRQTPAIPLTGKAYTYLQNQCRLDAQVSIYLLDPLGRHRVWGAFGPSPFSILNSMTVPTRLVEFKKGIVQKIRFTLQGDRKKVSGTMWAQYSGLQLELLGYKKEVIKETFFKKIVSKAANVLVIRDQNPRKSGELVTGEMTSTREPRFSVFTLWRQGVVSGLFNNVGVPQKLAQKLSENKDEAPLPK